MAYLILYLFPRGEWSRHLIHLQCSFTLYNTFDLFLRIHRPGKLSDSLSPAARGAEPRDVTVRTHLSARPLSQAVRVCGWSDKVTSLRFCDFISSFHPLLLPVPHSEHHTAAQRTARWPAWPWRTATHCPRAWTLSTLPPLRKRSVLHQLPPSPLQQGGSRCKKGSRFCH